MISIRKSISLILLCNSFFLFAKTASAAQLIIDSVPLAPGQDIVTNRKPELPFNTAKDIIANPALKSHIAHNRLTGSLVLELVATTRSKVKVRWNDTSLAISTGLKYHDLNFFHRGQRKTIVFTALQPTTGKIEVLNDKNVIIKTIHYYVAKSRAYNQSVGVSLSDNKSDIVNNNIIIDDNKTGSVGLNYRVSQKPFFSGDPYWSGSVSLNTNTYDDDGDRLSTSANFSYNW